ncbi:RNA-guided endonuclease InsQ/TnpB family protein [Mycolicibacterium holsaticum]|jgi:putative transposase|uniref:RNA-guided endonuclease InsQ/TnpB family protein n=1 Tax=Mycolicibacterium holsaticum TaxID=152142 RepID=UPI001C7DAE79|nr:RNA-guided endonuclease TnpB family protein [Mycolicibacterium holsaticum]MDA4108070.1 transposase [Mycolicibacterium holsaticum DSM 44478 = JCM 12374]QZA14511.1 transposase [Mycolicibacterium holsaticum DSM 44478 = JCM 12374]UNC08043.1 transposase [Mycolicibacterium holsaticum DSM 44478 = JCM 12374]
MSRFRLLPTPEQEEGLLAHCRDARYVWNLAVEQQQYWQPGRKAPGYVEQCAQLTEIRGEYGWLRAGSHTVQQQALRDFAQAMRNFFNGTHSRPTWRKAGVHEGFRQVAVKAHHVERLNRRFGRIWVPKVGWVRLRLSRAVPDGVKSYRVKRDRAGRWHIAFANIPHPITSPGDGSVVGVDRGVAVSAALSTGELLHAPSLTPGESKRLKVLQQRLARAKLGSRRREKVKRAIARLKARERDRRKDWVEKTTTDLAGRFDVIRVEALDARAMTRSASGTIQQPGMGVAQKRGLNRAISRSGWGQLVTRLQHKAYGRVEQVPAAYTSQRCSACGHVAPGNRKSQAVFECEACTAGRCNADVNAARNIAAGRAVTARGDLASGRSMNREPQFSTPAA